MKNQGIRFLLVGLVNTFLGYALFALLLEVSPGDQYLIAAVATHFVVTGLSFFLNRRFVFGRETNLLGAFLRFQTVYLGILGMSIGLLVLFVEMFDVPVLFAQAAVLLLVSLLSFLGHKFFSFRPLIKLK